jgi:hypothetical protein
MMRLRDVRVRPADDDRYSVTGEIGSRPYRPCTMWRATLDVELDARGLDLLRAVMQREFGIHIPEDQGPSRTFTPPALPSAVPALPPGIIDGVLEDDD